MFNDIKFSTPHMEFSFTSKLRVLVEDKEMTYRELLSKIAQESVFLAKMLTNSVSVDLIAPYGFEYFSDNGRYKGYWAAKVTESDIVYERTTPNNENDTINQYFTFEGALMRQNLFPVYNKLRHEQLCPNSLSEEETMLKEFLTELGITEVSLDIFDRIKESSFQLQKKNK